MEDEKELYASFKILKNLFYQDIRESELCGRSVRTGWNWQVGIMLVNSTQGSNRTLAVAFYKNRIYFPGILSPSAEKCT